MKACILPKNVVSLHRQSKEQPFVPCSGFLLRPTRVINDGRRRSSMKTPKTAGTGRSGELQTRTLNILQTTMINYSIVMRSVNANLLEINQAKSRINQAKKEGKTNVDLNAPTTPDNTPGGSTPGGSTTGQTGSEGQGSESSGGTTGKDDTGDGLE